MDAVVPDLDPGWWVVVPMKDTRRSKSRLQESVYDRRQLTILMARDTLSALISARSVAGVVVVAQSRADVESFALPGVEVEVCPGLGLNEAVTAGADLVRARHPEAPVAALPGDLPSLRRGELDDALAHAAHHSRAVVADRAGTGTTLLTAAAGTDLDPGYGTGSFDRHVASGAVPLLVATGSGLRRDIDTPDDLTCAPGLGHRTRALVHRTRDRQSVRSA